MTTPIKIEHAAAWVSDLERASSYYERWFQAKRSPKYSSTKRPFTSYFLSIGSGARLELMESPAEAPRMAHIAISVGSREAVDGLIEEMKAAGVPIVSGPRTSRELPHYSKSPSLRAYFRFITTAVRSSACFVPSEN
jgi:lactoylglutathione lyase